MSIVNPLLELRPYQLRCKHLAHEALRAGHRRIIVCAPTGSGKRVQAVWWARNVVEKQKECLVVTNRCLGVEQGLDELHRQGIDYGVIMGGYEEMRTPRVQVATIQSLEGRYLKGDVSELPSADVIIIDECHQDVNRYMALLKHYPDAYVFLLTATPVGSAGRTLIQPGYADVLTEGVKNAELIRQGYLLPTLVVAPSEPNVEGVKIIRHEEYSPGELGQRIAEVTCFGNFWNEWACFADRQTILFAPSIAYANGIANGPGDSFRARGIPYAVLHSGLPPSERDESLAAFRAGDVRVIVSVDMIRENFDCSAASCAIDLQPSIQFRSWWQKLGRIKRPHPGQDRAVFLDMAGNYWRHDLHPDDDPDWLAVTGDKTTQMVLHESKPGDRLARCPKCGAVYRAAPRCPECGNEPQPREIVRRIRLGNGKYSEVSAERKYKVEKSVEQRKRDQWKSCLFIGLKSGRTLKQIAWICKQRSGEWPHPNWPCVPSSGSAEWSMCVDQCFDVARIMREFGR